MDLVRSLDLLRKSKSIHPTKDENVPELKYERRRTVNEQRITIEDLDTAV